jgi:hypothetical protein
MADFGVLAAADQLQQDRAGTRVGDFKRVEVVKRGEFLVAANRQPIVEHAGMLRSLGRLDCPQRGEQLFRCRLLGRLHARFGRPHLHLRLLSASSLRAWFLEKVNLDECAFGGRR